MKLGRQAAPPETALRVDGESRSCPECEHSAEERVPFRLGVVLAQRLGFRPPRARCRVMLDSVESEVGMPGECWCGHPFHGS